MSRGNLTPQSTPKSRLRRGVKNSSYSSYRDNDDSGNVTAFNGEITGTTTPINPPNFKESILRNGQSSTPKTKRNAVFCPFTTPKLDQSVLSHSAFTFNPEASQSDSFSPCVQWRSTLNMSQFDLDDPSVYEPPVKNESAERQKQAEITRFFEQPVEPSPYFMKRRSTLYPSPQNTKPNMRSVQCQTTVTINPNIDLGFIFNKFATYEDPCGIDLCRDESILSNSSTAMRRLFDDEDLSKSDDSELLEKTDVNNSYQTEVYLDEEDKENYKQFIPDISAIRSQSPQPNSSKYFDRVEAQNRSLMDMSCSQSNINMDCENAINFSVFESTQSPINASCKTNNKKQDITLHEGFDPAGEFSCLLSPIKSSSTSLFGGQGSFDNNVMNDAHSTAYHFEQSSCFDTMSISIINDS